jgi:hypothetical protein
MPRPRDKGKGEVAVVSKERDRSAGQIVMMIY